MVGAVTSLRHASHGGVIVTALRRRHCSELKKPISMLHKSLMYTYFQLYAHFIRKFRFSSPYFSILRVHSSFRVFSIDFNALYRVPPVTSLVCTNASYTQNITSVVISKMFTAKLVVATE